MLISINPRYSKKYTILKILSQYSIKPYLLFHSLSQLYKQIAMITTIRTQRSNLLNEIDQVRNYYEHRRRIDCTKQATPLSTLKKSMSYDRQKIMLHQYLKNRKHYSNNYYRRQTLRNNESRDSKMLSKILEYDKKQFVFSMNSKPLTESSLHHHSMVRNNKKNYHIDQQNQKIHFRITKTKSLYSHLFPGLANCGAQSRVSSHEQSQAFNLSASRAKVQTENAESIEKDVVQNIKDKLTDQLVIGSQKINFEVENNKMSASDNFTNNAQQISKNSGERPQTSRKLCERMRRQKLAQNLFEKKQKLQSKVVSKLNLHKN